MKKWIALLLAGAMLLALCACGNSGAPEEPTPAPDVVVEPEPEPEPTPEPEPVEPEPEAEPEPAAPEFTNPLTGEAVESDISMKRPIAVMMNSLKKALPQSGCSSADLLIEITEEGGITRVMGVFQDPTGVGDLGTIRSVREYFAFIAMGYDAVLCHCGGSNFGIDALARHNYPTLNEMSHGNLYWRDAYRKQNVGYEHSLYTSSDNVQNYLAQTDKIRSDHEDGYACPLVFTDNGTPASGERAAQIDVSFSGYKDTHFTYDEATGKYKVVFFDDLPYVDANTDEQVAVTNVIVVVTKQTSKPDGVHQEYDLSSGSGYFACGGQYVPIHWSKGGETDPLVFTNTDGSPLELGVGNSYICVVDDDRPLSFQ